MRLDAGCNPRDQFLARIALGKVSAFLDHWFEPFGLHLNCVDVGSASQFYRVIAFIAATANACVENVRRLLLAYRIALSIQELLG